MYNGPVFIGLALAVAVPEPWNHKPLMRRVGTIGPLALLALQIGRLASGAELLPVAVEFAAGLQVIRLATRRGAAHDQQVIVLALMHLIAGTVLGGGLAYGLCFVGFLIVAPGALVLSHLRREVEGNYRQGARDRTGLPVDVPRILRSRRVIGRPFLFFTCLLSVPIFVFTAILFVAFPRVGLSFLLLNHTRPERMVGFSDRVDLGGVGKLRTDPTVVLRVELPELPKDPPPRLALYLKGAAFDRYDGRTWSRSRPLERVRAEQRARSVRILRFPEPTRDRKLKIDLEPIEPRVVFLPADAAALTLVTPANALPSQIPELYFGAEGSLYYTSPDERGLRYEVSLASPEDLVVRPLGAERARYLGLPASLPTRVGELARSWTEGIDEPLLKARVIEARLRAEYAYDLDSPSGAAENPLDHFLFESKRGHCEFYSTAMAVMLRTLGIPSRNVTGFIGGTYNRFAGTYAVRQGDAHSWVEAYIDGLGWTRFDPTPPASSAPRSEIHGLFATVRDVIEALSQRWDHHVVGYDLKQQLGIVRSVHATYRKLVPEGSPVAKVLREPQRLLFGVALLTAAIWLAVRFKRKRRGTGAPSQNGEQERRAQRVTELYRSLEAVLALHGAPRPPGTPPLLHAQTLLQLGHPLAAEVLALTEQYQRVRFGGAPFDEADEHAFAARVRALRTPENPARAA
nr:MAG: hypothetical protein DIU78_07880 [Pseudomonadota bacterium]